jgi:hypothetical protein
MLQPAPHNDDNRLCHGKMEQRLDVSHTPSSDLSATSTLCPSELEARMFSEKGTQGWRFWRRKPDARIIADSILGLSDGLTVPFALTAGLTAFGTTSVVILGGLAELIAGAISMGLGGFVGAKSEM